MSIEAVVWCPVCQVDKGTVTRVEVPANRGVFQHETEPDPLPKRCEVCDAVLERKP